MGKVLVALILLACLVAVSNAGFLALAVATAAASHVTMVGARIIGDNVVVKFDNGLWGNGYE